MLKYIVAVVVEVVVVVVVVVGANDFNFIPFGTYMFGL